MKHSTLLLALLSALVLGACASGDGSWFDSLNAPKPPETGPGCYDHKDLRVPQIMTQGECENMTWTWKR
jgi:hypothetical protein